MEFDIQDFLTEMKAELRSDLVDVREAIKPLVTAKEDHERRLYIVEARTSGIVKGLWISFGAMLTILADIIRDHFFLAKSH